MARGSQATVTGATSDEPELRADAARNRARVIRAARRRFATGGLEATLPMNTIAREAGVGVGTVYRHFPTRQSLVEGVAEDSFAGLAARAKASADAEDPVAGFEDLMRETLDLLLADPALASVLAAGQFECTSTIRHSSELLASITEVLQRARQAGAISPSISPDDIRRLICGVHRAVQGNPGSEQRAETYLHVLLRGLRTPSP